MKTHASSTDSNVERRRNNANRISSFAEDPLGSVISASVAVISSFGLVLSGIWIIHVGMN